jgi:hypothetical protein
MKKKSLFYCFCVLVIFATSCKKQHTNTSSNGNADTVGFAAKMITGNSLQKNWKSASANSNQGAPVPGSDYFAIRGGINSDQLTLMSFGKYIDDTSSISGRLTMTIENVKDTGTYIFDGINANYTVLSIANGTNLVYYSSDVNNQGTVVITKYDTINNTTSGTFNFTLTASGNIIQVENGIFTDIPFKQ